MNKYALVIFMIFSSTLQAQWFESSASAIVVDGDWQEARERAMKKAVKNALVFSGGTITSLQQVSNGMLVENQLILNSEGEIKALTIIDEQKNDAEDTINITLKVDIQPAEKICSGSHFPKSIALSRFKLNTPEQATDGNIFNINKQITKTLYNQLTLSSQSLDVRHLIDSPTKLGVQYQDNKQVDTLHSLARKTDSQFLIYGEINDISVEFESKKSLSYWVSDPIRHFYITIYLYDALQGQLVSTKQYRTTGKWQYDQHESANLQSKAFWQTQYGQAIIALLDEVTIDIETQVQCLLPTAKIIAVEGNSLQINLGRRNGLKNGTIVSLFYSSNYKDQFGIERTSKSQYEGAMKVIDVQENNATLRSLDNIPLSNIQINDLARIK